MNRRLALKIVAGVAALVVLVFLETQVSLLDELAVRSTFDGFGWWAATAFIVFYALATLLPLPKAVCTIAGGAIFGFWNGIGLVVCGAVIGSAMAFGLARRLGRERFRGMAAGRLAQLDYEVGKRGFGAVFAARLIPLIPFTTINYVFGLTAVTFKSYVVATAIGILPGTAIYVAVGAYGFEPGSWPFIAAIIGLIVLSLAGFVRSRLRARPGIKSTGGDATR